MTLQKTNTSTCILDKTSFSQSTVGKVSRHSGEVSLDTGYGGANKRRKPLRNKYNKMIKIPVHALSLLLDKS